MSDAVQLLPSGGRRRLVLVRTVRLLRATERTLDRLITRERVRGYSIVLATLAVLAFLAIAVVAPLLPSADGAVLLPDFMAHWTGGKLLLQGQTAELYDPLVQKHLQDSAVAHGAFSWFVSPPFAAVLYAPFAALPYTAAAVLWTVLSVACLVAAVRLLPLWAPVLFARSGNVVWLVVFASEPVLELFGSGQESAVTLLLWVFGIRSVVRGREVTGGIVLALGLFKPQQLLLVPVVLLIQRRWQALSAWLVTAVGLAAASVAVVGVDGTASWLKLPFSPLYVELAQVQMAWKMQSAGALITGLFPASIGWVAAKLGLLVSAALIGLFIWQAWRRRERANEVASWMLALLVTVLSSAHIGVYDLVLLIPPLLYVLARTPSPRLRIAAVCVFLLPWTNLLRHGIAESLHWPFTVVQAAWVVIPVVLFWKPLLQQMTDPASPGTGLSSRLLRMRTALVGDTSNG